MSQSSASKQNPDQPLSPEQGLRQLEGEILDCIAVFNAALGKHAISGIMIQNTPGVLDVPTPTVTIVANADDSGKKPAMRFQGKDLFSALRNAAIFMHKQLVDWHTQTGDFQDYLSSREAAQKLRNKANEPKSRLYIPNAG
jgi:hypothetical protein